MRLFIWRACYLSSRTELVSYHELPFSPMNFCFPPMFQISGCLLYFQSLFSQVRWYRLAFKIRTCDNGISLIKIQTSKQVVSTVSQVTYWMDGWSWRLFKRDKLESLWGPVYEIEITINAKAVRITVTASVYNRIDVQIHVDKSLVIIKLYEQIWIKNG